MPALPISTPVPLQMPDAKVWLQVCGWKVSAGFPSPAADHTRKRIDLNEHLIRNKEATFIFRVKGDSMIGIGIYEGDELLVDRSIEARHGNIVLAVLNSEFTVILKEWHFPNASDVYFDSKARDVVIAGKSRIAFGKGLRAVTHAAFTLGLLAYCRAHQTTHPGIVVLDSPLLAYREPDGAEDDLTGTDLQDRFYGYLESLTSDTQVIIVENTNPPDAIMQRSQSVMFGKNPHHGRYGLFPHQSGASASSA